VAAENYENGIGELVVLVTVSSEEEGSRIADALVSERLAACVNLIPGIESTYWWEGKVVRDRELLLLIKTTETCYLSLERRVKELHSYSTPEVIALKIGRGSREYLAWVKESASGC
jgi:periplasmic divalent cation tolerance protein